MTAHSARIDRVLFPTDFSPFSAQALRHALALTRKFSARLKVLHVIPQMAHGDDSMYAVAPWLMAPEVRQQIEDEMRLFLAPVREARIDHEVEISEGEPWREILRATAEMPADLVVMGTHGRSGIERLVLGSVTEKLIRRLPCPVLTVSHEEGHTWEAPGIINRILCATDFSDTSTAALTFAVALAEKNQAAITLLHVIDNLPDIGDPRYPALPLSQLRVDYEKRAKERLLGAIDPNGKTVVEVRVAIGRPHREILRAAAEQRADLIVVGAQGHGPIEHLLFGSNAQHVIRQATCPVLTVRPRVSGGPSNESRHGGLTLAPIQ